MNLKEKAKRAYDLSPVGWELGFVKNNCGNFSLLPMADGNWFCHMRIFAYWIDAMGRYCTNRDIFLSSPHVPQFCILDKDFNFIRKAPALCASYWRHPLFNTENPFLEDGRMVMWNNKPYIISTVCYLKDGRWNAAGLEVQEIQFYTEGVNVKHFWNSIERGIAGL